MAQIGTFVIYIIMICAVIGAIASIVDSDSPLGREFSAGLHAIGYIFIPVAGIMASIPYLSAFVDAVAGPLFHAVGADPAMAATSIIAVDMGGYQLARALAQSQEGWIMASVTGFMAGATIIFTIPVGLAMLDKDDHQYMAVGIMCGVLAIPVGVLVSCLALGVMGIAVRPEIAATGEATHALAMNTLQVMRNIAPLIVFCLVLATCLKLFPKAMIRLFLGFGRVMYAAITLVLVFSIVEYFTGFFTRVFGHWGFAPIIADAEDQFRALEIAGYIGIMLCGAFPMVWLMNRFLQRPMQWVGARLGLSSAGTAGLLAAAANVLAMFRLVKDMPPRDKVLVISFAVCGAFMFGDHLAFSANFQPTIILPLLLGKLAGGIAGFAIAMRLQGQARVAAAEAGERPPHAKSLGRAKAFPAGRRNPRPPFGPPRRRCLRPAEGLSLAPAATERTRPCAIFGCQTNAIPKRPTGPIRNSQRNRPGSASRRPLRKATSRPATCCAKTACPRSARRPAAPTSANAGARATPP